MKTNRFIALAALLAVLAAGCGKDNGGRIRILAENMGGGAKVLVNTGNFVSGSSWVVGESIDINGVAYAIAEDVNDAGSYSLDVSSNMPAGDLYAVYPATTQTAGGNDVEVSNRQGSGETEITLNRLVVKYTDANHTMMHETIFPMARKAEAGSSTLLFQHLTAGFKFTMQTSSSTAEVASVKVVVQGTRAADAVELDGVTYNTHWAVQGPTMPAGDIGISGDRTVSYSSEMYFDMEEQGHDYVTVGTSGIVFCVPVTLGDVKRLTVTGYAADGSQLFVQTKNMEADGNGDYVTLERNTMYTIPTIVIN